MDCPKCNSEMQELKIETLLDKFRDLVDSLTRK